MLRCGCLPSIFLQSLSVALLSCFPSFPSFAVSRVSVIMRSVFFQFVQFHIFYSLSYFLLFPYRYKNDLKLTYYYYLTIYFNRLHNICLTCSQVEAVVRLLFLIKQPFRTVPLHFRFAPSYFSWFRFSYVPER